MEQPRRRKRSTSKFKTWRKKKKATTSSGEATVTSVASSKVTQAKTETKLLKSNSASTFLGLTLLLYPDENQYEIYNNNFYGFKVNGQVVVSRF